MPHVVPPSVTSEPGIYSKKRKFGVGRSANGGLFGSGMGSSLFDSLGQADPFAAQNGPHIERATRYLESFNKLKSLIPSLPSSGQRESAESIIKKGWYSANVLGIGGDNLDQLAASIGAYIKEPSQQFVRLSSDGKGISNTRVEKLDAFIRGVKELQNYMNQFLVQPIEIRTQERVVTVPGAVQTQTVTKTVTVEKIPIYVYIAGGVAILGLAAYFLLKD